MQQLYMCEGGMFYFSNFVHLITLGQTCSAELIANINVLWRNFNIWAEPKCELMNSNPNLLIRTNASKALCEKLMWYTIFSNSQLCLQKQMPVMGEEVWISVTVIGCSHWISVFEYSYTMCMTLKCCPLQKCFWCKYCLNQILSVFARQQSLGKYFISLNAVLHTE